MSIFILIDGTYLLELMNR